MPFNVKLEELRYGTDLIKRGFAKMQKGGVIMDVTTAEQAAIAEEAGAVAVMALERVPADIRAAGGVARMADPLKIAEIIKTVTIPVMAKARIGHYEEAKVLEALGVDMIDESEVLTPADPYFHVYKRDFTLPFVCGARDLGEAARRIFEGAAMIRTKGEAGTGNIIEAVRHMRLINGAIREVRAMGKDDLRALAARFAQSYTVFLGELRRTHSPDGVGIVSDDDRIFESVTLRDAIEGILEVLLEVRSLNRLPVVNFAAGGIATPADAALMMHMGCDGVFVGSGIFKSEDPDRRARAIVEAVTHHDDPSAIAEVSKGLGQAMKGLDIAQLPKGERLQERGW
jgi:pyridoxal 5'-phosphate synthase pdxS subunit